MSLALVGMFLSPNEAQAQKTWGISLEPSEPPGGGEREFAPPPPPRYRHRRYRQHYRYIRKHRRRYRRRYRRCRRRYPRYRYRCGRRKPNAGFSLGTSRLWVDPDQGNLSWDLKLARLWMEAPVENGLWVGTNFQVLHMQGNRWFENIRRGDFSQQSRRWMDMELSLRYNVWYMRAGWTSFREVIWNVPDNVAQAVARENPGFNPNKIKTSMHGLGDNFILPYAVTGLRAGPLQIEAGAQLLGWDLRSYRLHSSLTLAKWGLGVQLTAAYQEDGMRMRLAREGEDEDDIDSNSLAHGIWQRRFWEIGLAATADLAALFGWSKNKWLGPLQLMVGVRYRNILENRLETVSEQLLFAEAPGSQWTFFAGLQIAFGSGNPVLMH